jgi:hypothetical protein
MELDFFRQVFEKHSNTKFHENLASGSRVVPCGQTDGRTDGHDESNSRFLQFCERVERKEIPSELIGKSDKLLGFKNSSLCII